MQIRCSTVSVILNVTAIQYNAHSAASSTPVEVTLYSDGVVVHMCVF